ncbi:MAG: IS481 family transposase [Chloroflexi bacterium]|nr:IS481 family transposase [Chloroflexota bacterium]
MAHPKARLNVLGRELLVTRVTVLGWPLATAAEAQGISRATGYKWVRRFRAEGAAGLVDRSSRPHRSPRATPAAEVARILAARSEWRWGPDRLGPLLELPPSTVAVILHREGVPRLADLDRPTGLPVRRYEACHPGALVHQDHKKLGRIPEGGGHRALGRSTETRRRSLGLGYDHFEVIVDDRSRRSVVVPVADESGPSAAAALELALATFEADGIAVERVMTDNAFAYRSGAYRSALNGRRQTRTRPYRPQTNGKAERFIGTLVREWAYARTYTTNAARLKALPGFVAFYNHRRPHTALGGLSPAAVVNNVHGDHS